MAEFVGVPPPDAGSLADADEVTVDVARVERRPHSVIGEDKAGVDPGVPHAPDASWACRDLWAFKDSITGLGMFSDRRLLAVFTSPSTREPSSRFSDRLITSTPRSSDTSVHDSPSASPRRSPKPSIVTYSASSRWPFKESSSWRACFGVSVRPSFPDAPGSPGDGCATVAD